jgi:hypothetical protein
MQSYRRLDSGQITKTLQELRERIADRFPDANLGRLCDQLLQVSREASDCVEYLDRPNWLLRAAAGIAILVLASVLVAVGVLTWNAPARMSLSDVIQTIEAGVNDVVFFGVAVFFILSVESRVKRRRALRMLHELRSLAHIVDMHQLTKDPERLVSKRVSTSDHAQPTTGADLGKYLDFCSELLSLISKIAALFVQHVNDSVVLAAVNEIEGLTTGLSGKIWQKITILERTIGPASAPSSATAVDRAARA